MILISNRVNYSLARYILASWLILVMIFGMLSILRTSSAAPPLTFSSHVSYPVGLQPWSVAAFNRFGKPGLAVTNETSNTVSVMYGNFVGGVYDGTFGAATNYAVGSGPKHVVVGTFSLFSPPPSIVVANSLSNNVSVLRGTFGDPFQAAVNYPVGTFPESVALGDFNGDGRLDIAAANYGSNNVSILLENSGTFQAAVNYNVSANPEFVVVGDLNGDGKQDIATCNSGTTPGKVNVLLGNGDGTFQTAAVHNVGSVPYSMTLGDFNSDGNLDMATANHGSNSVSVILNSGNGVFQSAIHYSVGAGTYSVAAGDFNIDTRSDLVVANADNNNVSVLLSNANGTLLAPVNFPVGSNPLAVAVGDFNVDSRPDIAVASNGNNTAGVLLNLTRPANDDFVDAITLPSTSSGRITGTNAGATKEANERDHAGNSGGASVWYRWQAPFTGNVTFTTLGSGLSNSLLAVYTGSNVTSINEITFNDNDTASVCQPNSSRVTFPVDVTAGTVYNIVVDGFNGQQGSIVLSWGKSATISGSVTNGNGGGASGTARLEGAACRQTSGGPFAFTNVPTGFNYTLNVSAQFANFSQYGQPSGSITPLTGDVSGFNFVQTTPAFSVGGNVTIISGDLSGITITSTPPGGLFGSQGCFLSNNAFTCSGLWQGTTYDIVPSKPNYSFNPSSRQVSSNTTNLIFTGSPLPGVSTAAANPITSTSATLNGNVNPNGLQTNTWFEWGTDPTLFTNSSTSLQSIGAGTSSQQVSANLTGLSGGVTYYFRAVASSSAGIARGSILSFVTPVPMVQITVQTNPAGRTFTVDGTVYTTAQIFNWASGSTHTISTTPLQSGGTGTQYMWSSWNDDGAISHSVTAPISNTTYTANFHTQYLLTTNAGPGGTASPTGFFNSGEPVQITATPDNGFDFTGWTGTGTGSFQGSTNPAMVTMNGPITQTASFTPAPVEGVKFSASTATATETLNATTKLDLTVTRSGNTSGAATVNYASSDGTASERSDYLAAVGTLRFAAGEIAKTISVFIVDDFFGESAESFNVTLSNPVGSSLGSPATITVNINSNEAADGPNPVRDATFISDFFVRQHYVDFFNREADGPGLAYWKNQIDECTTQACREIRRINVSAAFFVSGEFQQTGYLVYKAYQASFNSGEFLKLRDFLPDLQEIGRGVVIGQPGTEAQLEANKQAFFNDFVQRGPFLASAAYPITMTAAEFVDKLNANTFDPRAPGSSRSLSSAQRDGLVAQLSTNPSSPILRAQVLREVSENQLFSTRQYNKAFVLMQYFGYLRRNPNDAPELTLDFQGYNFWLGKLNQFGNFQDADMVKSFIISGEYQRRFGP